jgi:hypothetical protein
MAALLSVRRILRDSIRIFFAPLIGAIKGMRAELRRVDDEIAHRRSDRS